MVVMSQNQDYLQNLERILLKDLFTTLIGEKPTKRAHYLHDVVYKSFSKILSKF